MRNDELYHYGILGMKWGVRRYQNEDGTWTNRGKSRRNSGTRSHKKLTSKQKENIKKAAKYAAIGIGVTGAAVGGALLAKKYGPKALSSLKTSYITKIKGPNLTRNEAIERIRNNHNTIDQMSKWMQTTAKGSDTWKYANNVKKQLRRDNAKLYETKFRTGMQDAFRKAIRTPNDISVYGLSDAGKAAKSEAFKEGYSKATKAFTTVGGAVGAGGLAYLGAATTDKLFDESRDKRIARRMGQKYVKKPMNARASDYMFPNPYKKK